MLLPRNAPAWLDRLVQWLAPFENALGHVAQRGALRYVLGLLSDSRRKSMSAMLERLNDPGAYQAFQHFITDAPWTAAYLETAARGDSRSNRRADSGRHTTASLYGR